MDRSKYCARCQDKEPDLVVRTEPLCRSCFIKYFGTKILKRLEANKIRGRFNEPQKNLLVPVSFGYSSTCLLHVLDEMLEVRTQQGRHAGYNLQVLFVDQSTVPGIDFSQDSRRLLMQRYPAHTFTTISLQDCSDYGIIIDKAISPEYEQISSIVTSLPSATSKADFVDVMRRRLIQAFAEKNNVDTILFGDSTTRIAERTLSETAKGRGVALPWLTADRSSVGAACIYPLRDLLRNEVLAYANTVSPPLTPMISVPKTQTFISSKDSAIDCLMSQYFESVEQNYPSIVANVVRTSGKLIPPETPKYGVACSLCGYIIVGEDWGGDQVDASLLRLSSVTNKDHEIEMCYGCQRTLRKD